MADVLTQPAWLWDLLGVSAPAADQSVTVCGRRLTMVGGVPRVDASVTKAQGQSRDAFSFKWAKRDTFEGGVNRHMQAWLAEKYGNLRDIAWFADHGTNPIVLDAGCGAAMSGLALFEPVLDRIRYLGVDISSAIDVAAQRFAERGMHAAFLQADLMDLPLPPQCVDVVFSEGVLHHTDDTRKALAAVTRHLKVGGRIMFYVYRRKGPIREFTDDYVRDKLQSLTPQQGWDALEPLTRLGRVLGELNIDIEIPQRIDILNIPAGRIDLQRFFYWHVCKAFYRPELTLDEMNHINFDWYAPKNAHRQSPEDVRAWCADLSLVIEREVIEDAGITIIARRATSGGVA